MSLYDLPPELVAEILRFTDPSTFYILAQSVAPFLTAAASSKPLLLYQLGALPGLKYGLEDLTLQELISCFYERAARGLCGINALAGITLFGFGLLDFNVRQSIFYPRFNGTSCLFMVHRDEPCVYIFALCLHGGPPRFRTVVDLREHFDLGDVRQMSIVKIAVSPHGRRWAVLYNYEAVRVSSYGKRWNGLPSHEAVSPTTFMKERDEIARPGYLFRAAIVNQRNDMYHLILDNPNPRIFEHFQAVGFGITDDDHAAVCWRFASFGHEWNEVWASQVRPLSVKEFRGAQSREGPCELPAGLTYGSGNIQRLHSMQCPIQEIKFSPDNGRHLLLFNPVSPIHAMHLEYAQATGSRSIEFNKTFVDVPDGETRYSEELNIGTPFFVSHTTDRTMCTVVLLSIGATTDLVTSDAFIVRTTRVMRFYECNCEPALGSGIGHADWEIMVRLQGFMYSRSSLGPVAAISKDSRRFVVADWKTIRLWPLDPVGLVENDIDHYCNTNRQSDFEIDSGIGSIDPLELPTNGDVIHKLFFATNDLLYAITDHGLTAWDLSQNAGRNPAEEIPPWKNIPPDPISNPRNAEIPERICAKFHD